MESFHTIAMPYYGNPLPLDTLSAGNSFLPLDISDHQPNLESDGIDRFDPSTQATQAAQATQDFTISQPQRHDRVASYNNQFSDVLSAYEPLAHQDFTSADIPPIDRDNKLLSFSPPIVHYNLLNHLNQQVVISLSAQLHGSFFLTVSSWATEADSSPLTELTCYRRNLFQISGSITLPRSLRYILTEQGEQIPIIGQKLTVTAYESTEGTPVKIISVPFKTTSTTPSITLNDKNEKEPIPMPLDLMSAQSIDDEYVLIPLSWKRLQFRIATANNGRRKELQQQFIVRLKVLATLANGIGVTLCEADSGPIIVRGRSPRNFESRKDFPISCGYSNGRKNNTGRSRSTKAFSGDSVTSHKRKFDMQSVDGGKAESDFVRDTEKITQIETGNILISPDFMDWRLPSSPTGTMTAIHQAEQAPPSAPCVRSSPGLSRHRTRKGRPQLSAPISLSLLDEEPTKRLEPPTSSKRDQSDTQASSIPLQVLGSPGDAADLFYEYFPLGMDDWMPPVDAVYRPHVVHHTNIPPDLKALTIKSKSKRYFSETSP